VNRYKHSECTNETDTAICWAEKVGDNLFEGYNIGEVGTMQWSTLESEMDGFVVEFTGNRMKLPKTCAAGTVPKSIFSISCEMDANKLGGAFPHFVYQPQFFDPAKCEFHFRGYSTTACSLNRCPIFSSKYGTINLNALNFGVPYTIPKVDGPTGHNQIQVLMCGAIRPGFSNCTTGGTMPGVSVCEEWQGADTHANFKIVGNAMGWTIAPIDGSENPNGVTLMAGKGEFSNTCEHSNYVKLDVVCDKSQTGVPAYEFISRNDNCLWSFTARHSAACIDYINPGPGVFVGGKWLSLGSVLLIIFFVSGAVYLIIGVGVNSRRGKAGADMIPNRDTWASLWTLSMEGWAFTFSKVTGRGSTHLYDTV